MTFNAFYKVTKTYSIVVLGLFLYSLGWTAFILPHQITGGGISGVGALVYYATGFPVGYTFFLVNIVLIIVAIKILGASFGLKTIIAVIAASILLAVMQPLITEPVVEDKFLAAIIGGILSGLGLGIIFTQGGSTGGTDIIAMIVNKYRNISPGKVIMLCDVFIIGSSFLVLTDLVPVKRIETIVYGYVSVAITGYVIDAVLSGSRQSVQMFIFSKKFAEIADGITKGINRGVTVIDGVGWYTKENQKVVITLVRKHEVSDIYKIIKEIDDDAFVSVANVMGVYGHGFERIRS
ncbi:MAG: YitT family protein [Bacteroidales bacterium]|nr:YitT family protein [Bacteroidales bacterium]MDD3892198.1 YitT family protein [Bacteroidales bacterium]